MTSRSPTPQSLFFGSVVCCAVTPVGKAITPQGVGLSSFVAFADSPLNTSSQAGTPIPLTSVSPAFGGFSLTPSHAALIGPRDSLSGTPLEQHAPIQDPSPDNAPLSHSQTMRIPQAPSPNEPTWPSNSARDDATETNFPAPPPLVLQSRRRQTAVFVLPEEKPEQPPKVEIPSLYRLREATVHDAEGIFQLTTALDMTNATSYVWPLEDLRKKIADRNPMTIVAVEEATGTIAGCAGIDTIGMHTPLRVLSVGSRASLCAANEEYDIPNSYCMCRGLLIHPQHQSAGLGSKLHRYRIETLVKLFPDVPAVVLSARGSTFEEAAATLGPLLQQHRESDVTPQFAKDVIFQFTFHTSHGVVHLAHHRERDGWRFVGVDVSDGGPVWCTAIPLPELVAIYPQSRRQSSVFLEPIEQNRDSQQLQKRESILQHFQPHTG